jgi:hypothetical protein
MLQYVPFATPPQYASQQPQYVQPPEVPAWTHQLWAPLPFVDLVFDDEKDGDTSN